VWSNAPLDLKIGTPLEISSTIKENEISIPLRQI
jgi:hypothetical protein